MTSALSSLTVREVRVVLLAAMAVLLSAFDGSLLALALPAIQADLGVQLPDLANLLSVLRLGALGGLPLAVLADRTGRRRLVALGVLLFGSANVASAFASNLTALGASRLLASCCEGMVDGVAVVMVVEEVAARHRVLAVGALALASALGQGATLLAYPLLAPNWRPLYLVGGVGLLAALGLWRWLPESRTWQRAGPSPAVFRLLLDRPWRRRLAVLAVSAGVGSVAGVPGAYFMVLFASRSLGLSPAAISAVMFASAPLAIAGYLAGGFASERGGRRRLGVGLSVLTALVGAIIFAGGVWGFWVGNLLQSLIGGAAGPIVAVWFAEVFPTRARATGQAVVSVASSVGGILGLQLVGRLAPGLGLGRVLAALTVGAVIGVAALVLLPETRWQPLDD